MIRPKIKAAALENLTDARYFAARNVQYLSFILDESNERSISLLELNAIKEWIEGPEIILELGFTDLNTEKLIDQLSGVDGIQVGGFAPVPEAIYESNLTVIREVVIGADGRIPDGIKFDPREVFVFDLEKNRVTHDVLDMPIDQYVNWLSELTSQFSSSYFDLPYAGDQLNEIVSQVNPFGLQLKGSEEEKIGYKSYDDIDHFFDQYEDFLL